MNNHENYYYWGMHMGWWFFMLVVVIALVVWFVGPGKENEQRHLKNLSLFKIKTTI